jgi:hypothetical protein
MNEPASLDQFLPQGTPPELVGAINEHVAPRAHRHRRPRRSTLDVVEVGTDDEGQPMTVVRHRAGRVWKRQGEEGKAERQ